MQSKTSALEIVRAETMGMCFGVRDALAAALQRGDAPATTIWGELVHNERVLARLRAHGYAMADEQERAIPPTAKVLLTAHGVSRFDRVRLQLAGKELIDTTCPLVARAHEAARALQERGCHVIVIGKPGHVEVRGLVGDLWSYDVVARPEDVQRYPHARLGIVCQTTTPEHVARAVLDAVRELNPHAEILFADTICEPTRQRIRAARELAQRCEVVVVVGGRNSNNTRELAALCATEGARVHHVLGAADLEPAWFEGCARVGVTAGTSTLRETVDEVVAALERIARKQTL
jgi:4-hydroxy-3-methylbut-2-enyl diphosphate reductase